MLLQTYCLKPPCSLTHPHRNIEESQQKQNTSGSIYCNQLLVNKELKTHERLHLINTLRRRNWTKISYYENLLLEKSLKSVKGLTFFPKLLAFLFSFNFYLRL